MLKYDFVVMVCPTIGLITQFISSYLSKYKHDKESICICSKNELKHRHFQFTTDEKQIKKHLLEPNKKQIFCVTYASLGKFLRCLKQSNRIIDLTVMDEAQCSVGTLTKQLVYHDDY